MTDASEAALTDEVAAIGEVLKSLGPLSGPARERVIDYVTRALSIRLATTPPTESVTAPATSSAVSAGEGAGAEPLAGPAAIADIRSLKDAKQPSSANQMAALSAYYLSELAPETERSEVIDSTQLDRLFRQAGYPLPGRIGMTLPNATQAGYFDATGETGKYRLNPVGYNLVVHGLPSGAEGSSRRRPATKKAPAKRAATKKAAPKKATAKKR